MSKAQDKHIHPVDYSGIKADALLSRIIFEYLAQLKGKKGSAFYGIFAGELWIQFFNHCRSAEEPSYWHGLLHFEIVYQVTWALGS